MLLSKMLPLLSVLLLPLSLAGDTRTTVPNERAAQAPVRSLLDPLLGWRDTLKRHSWTGGYCSSGGVRCVLRDSLTRASRNVLG